MAKSLVIVESPAKAKTISKYLGKDYIVESSVGHIRDLPKKALPNTQRSSIPKDVSPEEKARLKAVNDRNRLIRRMGIDPDNGWARWVRTWTSEENRHGDTLNKYLYLSGRVNMREVEISTQHLIADGFDIGTATDPYKNFVYTSFQELATYVSHNNVAKLARKKGHKALAKMSKIIAGDEMRHHLAYSHFIEEIFKIDPSEMMLAYYYMMKNQIIMPAMNLRESFGKKTSLFDQFSIVAQRAGVYTGFDYVDIMRKLNVLWSIDKITDLNSEAEKARDYLMRLPDRMYRLAERSVIPDTKYQFKWMTKM